MGLSGPRGNSGDPSRGVQGRQRAGRSSGRARTSRRRGDDRENAKVADSEATTLGRKPHSRRRNRLFATAGRRATVLASGASSAGRPSVGRRTKGLRGDDRGSPRRWTQWRHLWVENRAGGGVTGQSRWQIGGRPSLTDPTAAA